MQLRSNIRGKTKIGYLVKADRSGRFVYAKAGEVPIGVIAESVKFGELCEIVTTGEALVYVHTPVAADGPIRAALTSEGVPAGSALPVGSADSYTSVGQALETGKGLIKVSVNLGATLSSAGGGIPPGGTTGQALVKSSATDYDVTWGSPWIPDAPSDGSTYGRYNGTWTQVFWQVYMGGIDVPGNEIYNGAFVNFQGDTTYIQVQWNQTTKTVELAYIGPTDFYTGWPIWVDDIDTTRIVTSGMAVNFKSGTYTTISHNFVTGPPPHNDLTFDINTTALDGRYYTQTYINANFYTQGYIDSNFDNYQNWGIKDGIYYRSIISGDQVEFSGDVTYIQVQYNGYAGGVHSMGISYVGPTDFYAGWDPGADSGAPTRVGSAHKVNFLGGTYLVTSYNFTAGSPPTHNVTIDIDTTALDGRYYTETEINTMLTSYALQSWVTANFDNYGSWDLETGGVHREYITSGFALDFVGDTTYIQVQYNGTLDRLEFSYVGPTSFYSGWDIWIDDVDTTRVVTDGMAVNFKKGTYTSITHNFVTGPPPHNDITIDINTTALDGRYYTETEIDTMLGSYATQAWVTANFDNYGGWDVYTGGIFRETIISGERVDFIGGTDIQVIYSATGNTLTFNYTGTPSYTSWNWEILGTPHAIGNGGTAELIAGTNVAIAYSLGAGGEHQATISSTDQYTGTVTSVGLTAGNLIDLTGTNPITTSGTITIDVDLSELATSVSDADGDFFAVVDSLNVQRKLTKANINLSGFNNDSNFATQTWVTSNFDNYAGWDVYTGGVFRETIISGERVDFIGGTDIQVIYSTTGNTLTFNYTGTASYTSWNWEILGVPHSIGNGGTAELIAGTGISIAYSLGAGGEHQATISSTASGVTVANQADNRVVTATATTDALNAESGLTYDGSVLTIAGNIVSSGSLTTQGAAGYSTLWFHHGTSNYTGIRSIGPAVYPELRFERNNGTTTLTTMVLAADGSVGVNQPSPIYALDIIHTAGGTDMVRIMANSSGSIAGTLQLANSNTGMAAGAEAGRIEFYKADASTQGAGVVSRISSETIDAGGTFNLYFYTGQDVEGTPVGSNGVMRLDYTDRLALGDGALTGTFALNQLTIDTSSGSFTGIGVIGDDLGYTGIRMYDISVGNMWIYNKRNSSSFGHIYLATGATPTTRLTINNDGTVQASAAITAAGEITSYASDIRLKQDIMPIHSPLELLSGINGVSFSWRDDIEAFGFMPSRKREHGFIAQNVQQHFPEAVAFAPFDVADDGTSKSGFDYLTVKPEKLIPVLLEAIKEVNDKFEKYKASHP